MASRKFALALQALFGTLTWDVVVLTMLYSTAGLGIAIVNDFKSIEGDRRAPARQCICQLRVSTTSRHSAQTTHTFVKKQQKVTDGEASKCYTARKRMSKQLAALDANLDWTFWHSPCLTGMHYSDIHLHSQRLDYKHVEQGPHAPFP